VFYIIQSLGTGLVGILNSSVSPVCMYERYEYPVLILVDVVDWSGKDWNWKQTERVSAWNVRILIWEI